MTTEILKLSKVPIAQECIEEEVWTQTVDLFNNGENSLSKRVKKKRQNSSPEYLIDFWLASFGYNYTT